MIFTPRRELLLIRVLAVSSFVAYIISQCYLLITEEHQRIVPYYPNPYFLVTFFVLQACVQVSWLSGLLGEKSNPTGKALLHSTDEDDTVSEDSSSEEENEKEVSITAFTDPSEMLYSLFYVTSNLCMFAWSYLWLNEAYVSSLTVMIVNATIQLCVVFLLVLPPNHPTLSSKMTHLAAKTGAGVAIMYMWKNCAVLDNLLAPATSEKIHSGVVYLLLTIASGPEPTFGLCLLYHFVALSLGNGQSEEWRHAFWFIAGTIALAVFCDFVGNRMSCQTDQTNSASEENLAKESSSLAPDSSVTAT